MQQCLPAETGHLVSLFAGAGQGWGQSSVAQQGSNSYPSMLQCCVYVIDLTWRQAETQGNRCLVQASDARFINASVEFDLVTLKPTYRLLWGQGGLSNALAVAEGLGFDALVIKRAREIATRGQVCATCQSCACCSSAYSALAVRSWSPQSPVLSLPACCCLSRKRGLM